VDAGRLGCDGGKITWNRDTLGPMANTDEVEERLAAARSAVREREVVARRLAESRQDANRVRTHLAVTADLVANEQSDVDRLEKGVGGMFRRIFTSREDLTREQKELQAAKLQHDALADELRAIEVDIAQLEQRAVAVAQADAQYATVLAEVEARAGAAGPHASKLAALAETSGRLRAGRKELDEAITSGIAAHDALVAVQLAVSSSRRATYGSDLGSSIANDFGASFGTSLAIDMSEHVVHEGLRRELAKAQHAMTVFQRECKDVVPTIDGITVTPLPGVISMIARDFVWSTQPTIDDVGAEIDLLSSYVATSTMELRGRIAQLDQAASDIAADRAALLDPTRDRL
jgi:hypothetical protein